MRNSSIVAIAALLMLLGGCCAPAPGCNEVDAECPPVEPIERPGYQVPVYEVRCDPVYEERRVPVWGHKTVPVYQERRIPVTMKVLDPCTGCERVIDLWDRTERVQVGVERVRACIGYRTEKVQVGTCPRRVQVGWRAVGDPCP